MAFTLRLASAGLFGGIPFTAHNFLRSVYDWHKPNLISPFGDGRTAFDFSYRIPALREWLTFYGEGFSEAA